MHVNKFTHYIPPYAGVFSLHITSYAAEGKLMRKNNHHTTPLKAKRQNETTF